MFQLSLFVFKDQASDQWHAKLLLSWEDVDNHTHVSNVILAGATSAEATQAAMRWVADRVAAVRSAVAEGI